MFTAITNRLDHVFSRPTVKFNAFSWVISIILAIAVIAEALLVLRFRFLYIGFDANNHLIQNLLTLSSYFMVPFHYVARGSMRDVPYIEWSIPFAMEFYATMTWSLVQVLKFYERKSPSPAIKEGILGPIGQRTLVSSP